MLEDIWDSIRENALKAVGLILFLAVGFAASLYYSGTGGVSVRRTQSAAPSPSPVYSGSQEANSDVSAAHSYHAGSFTAPDNIPPEPAEYAAVPSPSPVPEMWFMYITGSVRRQGVYRLPPGARLFDLVKAAGGFDAFADAAAVNMAAVLYDGIHVHVPRRGESKSAVSYAKTPNVHIVASSRGESYISIPVQQQSSSRRIGGRSSKNAVVNINTADIDDLTQLKGIGPAIAKRIIEYRNANGPFKSVDDLIQVKGIGKAKLKGLRGQASVQ